MNDDFSRQILESIRECATSMVLECVVLIGREVV
jgi:hypothetical protein